MINFSEYVFQQIQKYHTKPSDILILIFSGIVALATLVIIGQNISDKTPPNLLIPSANIIMLLVLIVIITYVGWRIPKTNNRIQQIEQAIILNQNMIDDLSSDKRKRILLLIEEILTKTKSSKETEKMSRNDKFNELMNYLKPIMNHEEAKNMAKNISKSDDTLEDLWLGPTKCDEKRTSREEELNKVWEIIKPMLEKSNFIPSTYHVVHLPLDLFREAQNCYQNGAYLATCGMCRVTIEALMYFAASRKPLDELNSDIDLGYINKKRLEFLKKILEKEILDKGDEKIIKEIWEAGDFVMHIHQRIDGNLHNFTTQVSQGREVDYNSLKGWSGKNEALKVLNQTASLISKVMRKMSIP